MTLIINDNMKFDETRDFPYYRNNPRISKKGWIVLLLSIPFSYIIYSIISLGSEFIGSLAFCLLLLIPLLYYSNWDYSLLFHKPTKNELILAFLMFIGYMVYSTVVSILLEGTGTGGSGLANSFTIHLESIVSLVFSMMGEELLKFIPLMFFMRLFYKYTNNRNLSIAISSVIILTCFGLLHYEPPYSTLISVLALQGLGSMFELYGYIRTKNLLVPYISHLLTDALVFILIFSGIA